MMAPTLSVIFLGSSGCAKEPERGIRFAPDVRHHRADARPVVTLRAADLTFQVLGDISDGFQAECQRSGDGSWRHRGRTVYLSMNQSLSPFPQTARRVTVGGPRSS